MKNFLRTHTNTILVTLAVIFLAVMIGYFSWGIGYIVNEITLAGNDKVVSSPTPSFNLQSAAALNYRNINVSSTAMAPIIILGTSTVTTTATTTNVTSTP